MRRRFSRSATRTNAASAMSIGKSLYFLISSLMRGASSRSKGKMVTDSVTIISQRAAWASHEKLSRYMASVRTGQTVPNGSWRERKALTQRAWFWSSAWRSATKGPVSISIISVGPALAGDAGIFPLSARTDHEDRHGHNQSNGKSRRTGATTSSLYPDSRPEPGWLGGTPRISFGPFSSPDALQALLFLGLISR